MILDFFKLKLFVYCCCTYGNFILRKFQIIILHTLCKAMSCFSQINLFRYLPRPWQWPFVAGWMSACNRPRIATVTRISRGPSEMFYMSRVIFGFLDLAIGTLHREAKKWPRLAIILTHTQNVRGPQKIVSLLPKSTVWTIICLNFAAKIRYQCFLYFLQLFDESSSEGQPLLFERRPRLLRLWVHRRGKTKEFLIPRVQSETATGWQLSLDKSTNC